jgi:hypothetical protein
MSCQHENLKKAAAVFEKAANVFELPLSCCFLGTGMSTIAFLGGG